MDKQTVAIIGLGRVGSAFLSVILRLAERGINLAYAVEPADSPGKAQAIAAGIKIVTIDEMIALGDKVDVIFDLTGNHDVRKALRKKLVASNNGHTVIASEIIARVIWSLITHDELPLSEGKKIGY